MKLSVPVYRLKHRAKRLSRDEGVPLHVALDRVAAQEGFASWSMLAAKLPEAAPGNIGLAAGLFQRLAPGDLLLLGARPGHGKTLMGLAIAVAAMRAGRRSMFFSLEYTERDMLDRFRSIGASPVAFQDLFVFDSSDAICADHIARRLDGCARGTLAVVDYLQLLDQKRDTPPLDEQIRMLEAFARERGVIFVFISQIDRHYDPSGKPCPDIGDVRLPNPLDMSLFGKTCFINAGKVSFQAAF